MAVRVVLKFDSDEDAKAFVKAALSEELFHDGFMLNPTPIYKVEAVYKAPTKFCNNEDLHRKGKTSAGWTRGAKWGWWVCVGCGKPTERWATGDIWHYSMGYNLLPPSVSPIERGQRSTAEWTEQELGLESPELSEDSSSAGEQPSAS